MTRVPTSATGGKQESLNPWCWFALNKGILMFSMDCMNEKTVADYNVEWCTVLYTPSRRPVGSWARNCKRSRSPGIDSKESIQLGWKSIPGLLKRFPTVLLHDCTVTNVLEWGWWPVSSAIVFRMYDCTVGKGTHPCGSRVQNPAAWLHVHC